jgi:glyoxylase-like metal-dependent hydrolase (beta-lactamase superfamily II)
MIILVLGDIRKTAESLVGLVNMNTIAGLKEIKILDNWFKVFQIKPDLFVISEPHHYEKTLSSLIICEDKAILIDTGCGIGHLKKLIGEISNLDIMVINTHTHTDHIGCNHQFCEIAMFDHPLSHQVSKFGVSCQTMQNEILAEGLIEKQFFKKMQLKNYSLPSFRVNRWLNDGDIIKLDNRELLVIYTPGEAEDHICLLDRENRILFCGDILMHGPIWTHLERGNLADLIESYKKLMLFDNSFDLLIPSHNEPVYDKYLLQDSLGAAEKVLSGNADFTEKIDPWNRKIREYSFGRFQILTNPTNA